MRLWRSPRYDGLWPDMLPFIHSPHHPRLCDWRRIWLTSMPTVQRHMSKTTSLKTPSWTAIVPLNLIRPRPTPTTPWGEFERGIFCLCHTLMYISLFLLQRGVQSQGRAAAVADGAGTGVAAGAEQCGLCAGGAERARGCQPCQQWRATIKDKRRPQQQQRHSHGNSGWKNTGQQRDRGTRRQYSCSRGCRRLACQGATRSTRAAGPCRGRQPKGEESLGVGSAFSSSLLVLLCISSKAEAEAGANANVASNRNIGVTLRLSNTQEEEQNDDEEPVISI